MEAQIIVKREKEDLGTNNCEAQTPIKSEQTQANDDEVNTPLREEMQTDEPVAVNVSAPNWESDGDDQTKTPPPPIIGPTTMITKRSDSFDMESRDNNSESEENANYLDLPEDCLDALLEAPLIKKEERPKLQLEFLDSITDWDLEINTNQTNFSNQNELDTMDLEPPQESAPNPIDEAELEAHLKNQLKTLNELKKRSKKKKKKNKKYDGHKKRHRSRSCSPSPHKERRTSEKVSVSGRAAFLRNTMKTEPEQLDYVPVRENEKSVRLIDINKLIDPAPTTATNPALTIKEKRQLAVQRVTEVLDLLRKQSMRANYEEFWVVDTIKVLPSTSNFMNCGLFENPSPLCKNYNVSYKFNSTTTSNVVLEKWGLVALPPVTTNLLRLTGIDALRLAELQQNSKLQLQKLRKQEAASKTSSQVKFEPCSTGLYKSVSTQTEGHIRLHTRDAAVQVMSKSHKNIFWLDSNFNEDDLPQQQTNVLLALQELCATMPSSSMWADDLFKALKIALTIKRAERKQMTK